MAAAPVYADAAAVYAAADGRASRCLRGVIRAPARYGHDAGAYPSSSATSFAGAIAR